MSTTRSGAGASSVALYWLPLGAGDPTPVVRWSGRAFEALVAGHQHRPRCALYHSALEVRLDDDRYVIEMAPVWDRRDPGRGVVGEGPVVLPWLGRSRLFRYEVRRWHGGVIPDAERAVDGPRWLDSSRLQVMELLELVPTFPTATWGRDEQDTGEMWNSNSLVSWLLARSHHEMAHVRPPTGGRAPGWDAGLVVAARQAPDRPHTITGNDSRRSWPQGAGLASITER